MMPKSYVMIDKDNRFAAVRGIRGSTLAWVAEYPDATQFPTIAAARKILNTIPVDVVADRTPLLVENYGTAQETRYLAPCTTTPTSATAARQRQQVERYETEILELIGLRDDITQSDLQAAVAAIVQKIIQNK
jgi:hypothetical protein